MCNICVSCSPFASEECCTEPGVKFLWTVLVKFEYIKNICTDSSLIHKCLTEKLTSTPQPLPLEHLIKKKLFGLFSKSMFSFRRQGEAITKLELRRTGPRKVS